LDADVEVRLREAGLSSFMTITPPVPHHEAVIEMMRASILLFSLSKEGNTRALVSGKVFEYLATGLPILSIGDKQSGANEVLVQAERNRMLAHDDAEGIHRELQSVYHTWVANNQYPVLGGTNGALRFSRQGLTGQLAQLMDTLVSQAY